MTTGPNQHHIPRFVQRRFGVKPKGQRTKEIWVYRADQEPELKGIGNVACEDHFYDADLDARFRMEENHLATKFQDLGKLGIGATVDAKIAAELVAHLAPRSSHLRSAMADGMAKLAQAARELFSAPETLIQLMGLDKDSPGDLFRERFAEGLSANPVLEQLGLPRPLLERVGFYIARENFRAETERQMPLLNRAMLKLTDETDEAIRTGHNRALQQADKPNVRRELLETFSWTVEAAPDDGAILPDCVALATEAGEPLAPFMFIGKEVEAVVLPVSTSRLVLGRRSDSLVVDLSTFNTDAAASSHEFFLANRSDDHLVALSASIGSRSNSYFDDATQRAIEEYRPASSSSEGAEELNTALSAFPTTQPELRYEVSFWDCADQETANRIATVVGDVVRGFGRALPLNRLEGLTFAADYPGALQAVDRGYPNAAPVETLQTENATGIAQTLTLRRDNGVMCRIVMNGQIGHYLIGDNEADTDWALNILTHQLALVAVTELIEDRLPGVLLNPVPEDMRGWLYQAVDSAPRAYVASSMSAGFGDSEETQSSWRGLLIDALTSLEEVKKERLAYRNHGDLDKLLSAALTAASSVLTFAAQLLGNCVAHDQSPLDKGGHLTKALELHQLTHWLSDFQRDLETFKARLGEWQSFEEFLAFTIHVERLMWSIGIFPWQDVDRIRVEVPLISDALALLAEMDDGPDLPPSDASF